MEIVASSKTEFENLLDAAFERNFSKFRPPVPLKEVSDDIDIDEVCKLTGNRPKSYIYYQTSQGDMPHSRRGKFLIFSRKEILDWLDSKTVRKVSSAEAAEAHVTAEAASKLLR
jgi:predicted DNA-binding transcriptional regulator AlpA